MLHATTAGAGPRVVLVHGFTQTATSWATIATDLAGDHQVICVDLPGHGRSGPACDLWTSADELVAAGGTATYVGYSLGGRVALHAALAHPGAVERLILLSATAGIDDEGERAIRRGSDEQLAADIERDGLGAFIDRWLALPLFADLPADAADRAERLTNTVEGLAASLRLAGTGTIDPPLWDRLGELAMPVLVLSGEHDTKFGVLAERLAIGIGSNADLVVIGGAGHAAHLEQPAAFVAVLRDWLKA